MSEARHAVLIASSRFPHESRLTPLRCPENDVDGMAGVLTSPVHGLFPASNVHCLKNRPHHEVLLKLNQVLQQAHREDFVLIYYSGHGKPDQVGRLHLAATNTSFDALAATSIPVENVKAYIDVSSARKVVFILDCCFSGAAGEAFLKGDLDHQLEKMAQSRGTYVLTASTGIQVAQEKEGDSFGVLTKHIIEGITGQGADIDGDGLVTMDELYKYVHRHVTNETPQRPEKFAFNVHGDLVLARTGNQTRSERKEQICKRLFSLADQKVINGTVFSKAIAVLNKQLPDLTQDDKIYDTLLGRLYSNEIEVDQFLQEWHKVGATRLVGRRNLIIGMFTAGGVSLGAIWQATRPQPRVKADRWPSGNGVSLGLTIWHLTQAKASAQVTIRDFAHLADPEGKLVWTPARVLPDQSVSEGDEIRFGVEAGQKGYLYVFNRDVYADGQFGVPILMFPTWRLREGNNFLTAGRPIEIPRFEDHPPTLTAQRSRDDQVAIQLGLIFSSLPLKQISTQREKQNLDPALVSAWLDKWGKEVNATEDRSQGGELYTKAEQTAAAAATPLDANDARPNIIFHRAGSSEQPMLATINVKFSSRRDKP